MPDALPTVQVVHAIAGRARLRVPSQRGNESFFSALARAVLELASVHEVRTSARTGSVLVRHDGALEPVLEHVARTGMVVIAPRAPHTPMRRIRAALEQIDERLATETDGTFSLGTGTFVGLLAAGLYQVKRGDFLPAGMTLFIYALGVMNREADRELGQTLRQP